MKSAVRSWRWNERTFGPSAITSATPRGAEQARAPRRRTSSRGGTRSHGGGPGGNAASAAARRSSSRWNVPGSCHSSGPSFGEPSSGSSRSSSSAGARRVAQPLHVREVAARLDREDEVVGRLGDPARDRVAARQPVEGRVHLDRVEPPGVEASHPARAAAAGRRRRLASGRSSSRSSRSGRDLGRHASSRWQSFPIPFGETQEGEA